MTLSEKKIALAKRDSINMLDSSRMHIQTMVESFSEEHMKLIVEQLKDVGDTTELESDIIKAIARYTKYMKEQ